MILKTVTFLQKTINAYYIKLIKEYKSVVNGLTETIWAIRQDLIYSKDS